MQYRLLTPGPTSVPPQVLAAMATPVVHHRTAEFRAMFRGVQEDLKHVFQTKNDVCIITGSGTAAFEAGLGSVVAPGARVLNIANGKFSRRWGAMCRKFGVSVVDAPFDDGRHVEPESMAQLLADASYDAIIITHSETSTATACDLEAVARVVHEKQPEALVIVDGITSIGAMPFFMDEWGIDVAVTGSQKALMCPPGLGFVALSDRAWANAEAERNCNPFYLDLRKYRKAAGDDDTPFTPANSIIQGLAVALQLIVDEGLENVWRRTATHAEVVRQGMQAIGLELFSSQPSDSVTAIRYPVGVDDRFRTILRDEFNLHLAGGQDAMTGKLFRVSHMGYTDLFEALAVVSATELTLAKLGRPGEIGRGVAAAQRVLAGRS